MSFVTTEPQPLTATVGNLQIIGPSMSAAALAPTTGVAPAAADEVSALTAPQFAIPAHVYQAISVQTEAMHQLFVSTLGNGATSYAVAEAANAIAAS